MPRATTPLLALLSALCVGTLALAAAADLPVLSREEAHPTMHKHACESCFDASQCASGLCHQRKCLVDASAASVAACFHPECAPCETRLTCASNRCLEAPTGKKCVLFTDASMHKCFPDFYPPPTQAPSAANTATL